MLIINPAYAINDVSALNVIFSMSQDTLTALFEVSRGVHDIPGVREGW
jgi:hypothetical protein